MFWLRPRKMKYRAFWEKEKPLWYSSVRNCKTIISSACNVFAFLFLQKFSHFLKIDMYFCLVFGAHTEYFPGSLLDIPFPQIRTGPVDSILGAESDVSLCMRVSIAYKAALLLFLTHE